jgi:outer membrane protein TolC
VLTGFQQVEDSLAALRILEAEAKAQDDAVKSSRESLAVTINQYRGGVVSYLNVIAAQSIALANEKSAVAILVQRQSASVLLILALGGGWDASSLETESSKAKN